MCTMILNECFPYYVIMAGQSTRTFLDATKAFDHVEYCKLCHRLYDRGLPPVIIPIMSTLRLVWCSGFAATTPSQMLSQPFTGCVCLNGLTSKSL